MRYSRVFIHSISYELASDVVSSWELEEELESTYKKLHLGYGQLEAITGIVERRFWSNEQSLLDGAVEAGRKAIGNFDTSQIGALIYGGVGKVGFEPATAAHVAGKLYEQGIKLNPSAAIFDTSNACLGLITGLVTIADRIELGQIKAGLVVASEQARGIVEQTIRDLLEEPTIERYKLSLATLTGGASAAAVLLTDGSFGSSRRQLVGSVVGSAPQHHMLCRWGLKSNEIGLRQFAETDSAAVLEHGVVLGSATWQHFLREMNWTESMVERTISHQVGSGHRQKILPLLGISPDKDFVTYDYLGNTGTVGLPITAAIAEERGFLKLGHKVAFLGIGSGLTCQMLGLNW